MHIRFNNSNFTQNENIFCNFYIVFRPANSNCVFYNITATIRKDHAVGPLAVTAIADEIKINEDEADPKIGVDLLIEVILVDLEVGTEIEGMHLFLN